MTPREKWVEALRSGEFEQTQGELHTKIGYCCLGVACELYRREHPESLWIGFPFAGEPGSDDPYKFYFSVNGEGDDMEDSWLPFPVGDWLGVGSRQGVLEVPRSRGRDSLTRVHVESTTLTEMNDQALSFGEIADEIERGNVR